MKDVNKFIIWIVTRSLKNQLHQNARISPAIELSKLGWHVTMVTSEVPDNLKNKSIHYLEVTTPKLFFLGTFIYYFKILRLLFSNKLVGKILFFQIDSLSPILLIVPIWQMVTGKKQYHVVMDYRSMPMDTHSFHGKLRSLIFYAGHSIAHKLDIFMTAITNRIVTALNICNEKIIGIWPSGANIEDFKIAIETRSWADENQPIRLVYIGAIHAERNLIAVIEAAIMAKKKGVDLTLDIIGAGYQKELLQKLVENKGNGFIKIWGPIPQTQIPKLLANYDIGVLPFPDVPKMNVSSAIKMFEYMAAGMPIMATKIEAHFRVFNGKDFVFWTGETAESMANAMAEASALKAKFPLLGKNSREFSKSWSWSESAKKLSNALERIPL
jgi:glycosyltransferase involved in cell wall biosynthesis